MVVITCDQTASDCTGYLPGQILRRFLLLLVEESGVFIASWWLLRKTQRACGEVASRLFLLVFTVWFEV